MESFYIQNLAENFTFLCFMLGMVFAWASLVFIDQKYILKIENISNNCFENLKQLNKPSH
jgi:hypothetical protein